MTLRFSESVVPITDLKTGARALVKRLKTNGRPILITQRGRAAAVLEGVETYERREAHYEALEGILEALRQAERGDLHPHEEALKILESF